MGPPSCVLMVDYFSDKTQLDCKLLRFHDLIFIKNATGLCTNAFFKRFVKMSKNATGLAQLRLKRNRTKHACVLNAIGQNTVAFKTQTG